MVCYWICRVFCIGGCGGGSVAYRSTGVELVAGYGAACHIYPTKRIHFCDDWSISMYFSLVSLVKPLF